MIGSRLGPRFAEPVSCCEHLRTSWGADQLRTPYQSHVPAAGRLPRHSCDPVGFVELAAWAGGVAPWRPSDQARSFMVGFRPIWLRPRCHPATPNDNAVPALRRPASAVSRMSLGRSLVSSLVVAGEACHQLLLVAVGRVGNEDLGGWTAQRRGGASVMGNHDVTILPKCPGESFRCCHW